MSNRSDSPVGERIELAIQLTEETLSRVTQLAIGQIRAGLETSSHVEAAERDIRSALRQLVLAEREQRSKSALPPRLDEQAEVVADVPRAVTGRNAARSRRGDRSPSAP